MEKNMYNRREFLGISAATAAGALSPSFERNPTTAELSSEASSRDVTQRMRQKPNIIIFEPDSLRASSIGCYGNQVVRTPNLDRFSSEGVRFSRCITQAPFCTASRCSMMTGWYPHVRGHRSMLYMLRPDEPNLFRYLKEGGYDIFWYGKNDMLAQECFSSSVTEWGDARGTVRIKDLWPSGDPRYYSFLFGPGGDRRQYSDYLNVQSAIRILERDSKNPFCIFLPLIFPHPPYSAPPDFYSMYKPSDVPSLRPIGLPRKPAFYNAMRRAFGLESLTESDFQKISAIYLGMVSYVDWLFGQLLNALDSTGHNQDTAVFFCSDHGDYAGDYGLVEKWGAGMENDLNHIPLIVRMPGAVKGHVVDEIVELFDIMPTCLDLTGIQPNHTHFAHSLIPQLHGKEGDAKRAAFCEGGWDINEPQCLEPLAEIGNNVRSIYYPQLTLYSEHPELNTRTSMLQDREYKLILRPDGQSELYNLKEDPGELHNVYGDRSHRNVQEALSMRMLDWYVRTSDVSPWNHDARGLPNMPPPLAKFRIGQKKTRIT